MTQNTSTTFVTVLFSCLFIYIGWICFCAIAPIGIYIVAKPDATATERLETLQKAAHEWNTKYEKIWQDNHPKSLYLDEDSGTATPPKSLMEYKRKFSRDDDVETYQSIAYMVEKLNWKKTKGLKFGEYKYVSISVSKDAGHRAPQAHVPLFLKKSHRTSKKECEEKYHSEEYSKPLCHSWFVLSDICILMDESADKFDRISVNVKNETDFGCKEIDVTPDEKRYLPGVYEKPIDIRDPNRIHDVEGKFEVYSKKDPLRIEDGILGGEVTVESSKAKRYVVGSLLLLVSVLCVCCGCFLCISIAFVGVTQQVLLGGEPKVSLKYYDENPLVAGEDTSTTGPQNTAMFDEADDFAESSQTVEDFQPSFSASKYDDL